MGSLGCGRVHFVPALSCGVGIHMLGKLALSLVKSLGMVDRSSSERDKIHGQITFVICIEHANVLQYTHS